ncbi:MAG: heavy metal translocating P-type ATPase [Ruminococcus sp.]|nr:heavy metal translocating P-type ATPase [Ruminococcus sp.]
MEQYSITGMSCAACSTRVEKAVSKVPGVTSCSVSLLTNSMGVEGTASSKAIMEAVTKAGYGAALKKSSNATNSTSYDEMELEDKETPQLKRRLIWSVVFLVVLMYFSMGHTMWGWPLPSFFNENHVAMGLVQLLLTMIIMVIHRKFFINGWKGLVHRSPNMDTLVALGAGASFVYSLYALFAMTDAQVNGGSDAAMHWMHEFYFESAAMILTLITIGKTLEAYSKGKTTDALKGLMQLAPKTAVILRDGEEITVPIEQIQRGSQFVVHPGEAIPVDGVILEGHSAIDKSALTGESVPVDKTEGDAISAATINRSGFIRCEATRVGEDTTLSQIIRMVSDAAATKVPIARIANKVSGVFVPTIIAIAVVTIIVWLLVGQTVGYALARGISVLVISCPCALGLATPVAIMVGNGVGAKNGILFKTAVSLEETGKMQIVALDKTGTITVGAPKVTDLIPAVSISEAELLRFAFALEQKSEHPLAKAILQCAQERQVQTMKVTDFTALPGNGLTAMLEGKRLYGGNFTLISTKAEISPEMRSKAQELSASGKTPLFFSADGQLLGIIAVADVIKEESPEAIRQLQNMGIYVVMLTGDNQRTAQAVGQQAGVNQVIADVLPDGKESVIRQLHEQGKVIMVGDGINDAPALTRADTGIAIGAGTDVAIDAADVVLMNSRLTDVPAAIRLSRAVLRNIHENLFWAFIYNIVGIPLAAGLWIPLLGWSMSPMYGAAAMSLSSFCVVMNALRLNLFHLKRSSHDRIQRHPITAVTINQIQKSQEENQMEVILNVKDMMCSYCEATVQKAVEAFSQVDSAKADHESGTVAVKLNAAIDGNLLKQAIIDKGYEVE